MPSQPPIISKPSLTIKRRIDATPEKLFRAWTEPEKITRWFGPEQVVVVHAETDARVGGLYRIVARSPDGEQHEVSGSTARWCRTRSWCSPGRGGRCLSASRS
jgi:uncharacterized protein YndB with AHSA1/START domain